MLKLKIPPAGVLLMCIGLMWVINEFIPIQILLFESGNYVARGLLILGVLIGTLGLIEFSRKSTTVNPQKPEKTTKLVRSGIYRFTRNPMYLGMLVILLAGVVKFGNGINFLVIPGYIWYMNTFQIQPEEEVMEEKFGKEFKNYKSEVRRWL
ncbi:MAG: isoprenylcysteine carboxylmethyltransferase family protein [Gracilimonas sp.]